MRANARNRLGASSLGVALAIASTSIAPRVGAQSDRPAPTVEACFSAAEQAQPLMKQRKLRAARRQLEVCAREECPRAARNDCRTWLADVTHAEPTIVFVAREQRPDGESVAIEDVRVSADGEVIVPSRLDGRALAFDPGVHTLTFEHAGFDPVEQRIDVREGERDRQMDVVFRASPTHGATAPSLPRPVVDRDEPEPPLEAGPPSRPVPGLVYGLGAVAIVALGAGITLEAIGLSNRSHLESTCQPTRTCNPSDVSAARTRVAVGDAALGASALLFAGAALVYFTRDPASTSSATHLRLGPVGAGVGAGIEGPW
jgi:hypothetical protein